MQWKYILIVVVVAVVAGGGILSYQYWEAPRTKIQLQQDERPEQAGETTRKTQRAVEEGYQKREAKEARQATKKEAAAEAPKEETPETPKKTIGAPEQTVEESKLSLTTTKLVTIPEKYRHYSNITLSPNGRSVAYVALRGTDQFVVISHIGRGSRESSKSYDVISELTFSPDSQRLAYVATDLTGEKKDLVVEESNGETKPGKRYDFVCFLVFSPDGQKTAYVAKENNKWFVVIREGGREREEKRYDKIYNKPVFSADRQYISYGARDGRELWWIVNKVE